MDYEPTTEGAGQKHTECTVCGATVSIETIPALPDPDEEETEPESTDIPSDTDVDTAPAESEPVTDPVTSHASDETTEGEPTDETTDEAPSPDTTAPTGGCGAVITSVALITFMAAGVATVCTRKKKD